MPLYPSNGIDVEVQLHGDPTNVPLVLIRGLGTQIVHWPTTLIDALVASGLCVAVFDNRDAGLSAKVDAPYTLADMADDTIGVVDALDWHTAHLAGVSLGGMIVQRCAIRHPDRLRSATTVMSAARWPWPGSTTPAAAQAMTEAPADPADRQCVIEAAVAASRVYDGTRNRMSLADTIAVETAAHDRCHTPEGTARQQQAMLTDLDRRPELAEVRVPMHVIHGSADPLVPVEAGRETAASIAGARYTELEGFGHVIGPDWGPELAQAIASFVLDVEARR